MECITQWSDMSSCQSSNIIVNCSYFVDRKEN